MIYIFSYESLFKITIKIACRHYLQHNPLIHVCIGKMAESSHLTHALHQIQFVFRPLKNLLC